MQTLSTPETLTESPLYLLAALYSARQSKDASLERITRARLESLGIKITFADELPDNSYKGRGRKTPKP